MQDDLHLAARDEEHVVARAPLLGDVLAGQHEHRLEPRDHLERLPRVARLEQAHLVEQALVHRVHEPAPEARRQLVEDVGLQQRVVLDVAELVVEKLDHVALELEADVVLVVPHAGVDDLHALRLRRRDRVHLVQRLRRAADDERENDDAHGDEHRRDGDLEVRRRLDVVAHARGHDHREEARVPVLVDGAQSAPHLPVDVRDLDCDFYTFSAHKLFGPTGVGILYGKKSLLEAMPPYEGGGSMIHSVSFEKTTYADLPAKFEAGTPHIAGGIGLEIAIDYINAIGREQIAAYETDLLNYGTELLQQIEGLRIIGNARQKVGVISFVMDAAHPHDVGTILDTEGIAVRAGHHCAQPTMQRYGVPATVRASLAFYNTRAELDALAAALHKVIEVFG